MNHEQQPRCVLGRKASAAGRGVAPDFRPASRLAPSLEFAGQFFGVRRGKGDDLDVAVPIDRLNFARVFFEHTVKVAAAETESADGGPARMFRPADPRTLLGIQIERRFARFDGVERLADFDGRGQHFVVQRQGRFNQSRRAGRRLGVADLRLHGTQSAPSSLSVCLAVDFGKSRYLDAVADSSSRAVAFNEFNGVGRYSRQFIGVTESLDLPGR